MKVGRNDYCPCGSGIKYKRCCMDRVSKQHAEVFDDVEQIIAMNPSLTLDELNAVAGHRVHERNNRPNPDFYGLSPAQMANWLYAPFNELALVKISTPDDLSSSPVMRYLALIIDEAIQNGGSFKLTSKGNLPVKIVKKASELLPEFAVAVYGIEPSISEFSGSNEDKFNALHYTRILAEITGIIYRKNNCFHIKKEAEKQYQTHGVNIFFLPMLEATVTNYNWGYLDNWQTDADLRMFWLFMLWRIQSHGSVDQLLEEVATAFPDLCYSIPSSEYQTSRQQLDIMIESRFIKRFLQFWGFITVNPKRFIGIDRLPIKADIQPLLTQTFQFSI